MQEAAAESWAVTFRHAPTSHLGDSQCGLHHGKGPSEWALGHPDPSYLLRIKNRALIPVRCLGPGSGREKETGKRGSLVSHS